MADSQEKPIGQQNYEQFADRYAAKVATKGHNAYYERPATLSLLPDVTGLTVLDAGCGPGIYSEWLVGQGAARVVALDVTPEMVDIARKRVQERVEFHVADLDQRLDFAGDGEFDLVVCPLVLDYLADWRPVFGEFFRVLKPGGVLVFSCGHPASDFFIYNPDGVYFNREMEVQEWHGFGEPYPVLKWYRRPLAQVLNPLAEAGFRLDHILEPQPVEAFKAAEPDHYEALMRQPGFLCVRAIK